MATTAPLVWFDGRMVAAREAALPVTAHAAQRGSLVFDVGSFHETPRGVALFRAAAHVARLARSAARVGLTLPFDEGALLDAARAVVAANEVRDGLLRWSVLSAATEPDLTPRTPEVHVVVAAQTMQDPPRTSPLRVAVFDDAQKAAPEAIPPDAKVAAAYLGPLLARRRAALAGADEVVLLDREGGLAEGPTCNLFLVRQGILHTPGLTYVLPGVTRATVLTLAREEGISAREGPLDLDALLSADEAFLTATSLPVAAVGWVNGRALARAPGPVTALLARRLDALRRGREAAHAEWLEYVRQPTA